MENSEEELKDLAVTYVATLKDFGLDSFEIDAVAIASTILNSDLDGSRAHTEDIKRLKDIFALIHEKRLQQLNAPKVDKEDKSCEKSPVGFNVKYKRIRPDWMRVIEGGRPW